MTVRPIGFGRRLAPAATRRGDRVIATARNVGSIEEMAALFVSGTDFNRP